MPVRRLKRVDLPTLGRPQMATSGSEGSRGRALGSSPSGAADADLVAAAENGGFGSRDGGVEVGGDALGLAPLLGVHGGFGVGVEGPAGAGGDATAGGFGRGDAVGSDGLLALELG